MFHFIVDGYVACLWFGAIKNSAVMNILVHVFWQLTHFCLKCI